MDYTAPATHMQHVPCPRCGAIDRPARLVVWLRCRACQRGYFAAGAPGPQPCPACSGGRLQPVALWDLRTDAMPPGMPRLTMNALVRGEVVR